MLGAVAKRYATALFDIAVELDRVEEIDAQAQWLEHLYDDRHVKRFFTSPQIPAAAKKRAVERRLADHVDHVVVSLVKLLVDKKRLEYLPAVMRYFDLLTDQYRGVEEVSLVSAVPLTEQQLAELVAVVRRFSQYDELRVRTEVAEGVLGGVKVKLGERLVIDGTVSTRLRTMYQRMYRYRHRGVAV